MDTTHAQRRRELVFDHITIIATKIAYLSTVLALHSRRLQLLVVSTMSAASTSLSSTIGKMDTTRVRRRRELVFDCSTIIQALIAYLSTVLALHYRRIRLIVVLAKSAAPISVVDDLAKWTRRIRNDAESLFLTTAP
jgi:hypothetical protein